MTLEEIRRRRKNLNQEFEELKKKEELILTDKKKKKYEGQFVLRERDKFAMRIRSVQACYNGTALFVGDGIEQHGNHLCVGPIETKDLSGTRIVTRKEFIKFIVEKVEREIFLGEYFFKHLLDLDKLD